jgi:methylthioribulose-1-phosphate dehydratase
MDKDSIIEELIQTISTYHSWGWSPATSTNYSFVDETSKIWVTISGIDKSRITKKDFISIDLDNTILSEDFKGSPSAETLIHCTIYKLFPETKVILHSHGLYPNLLSSRAKNEFIFNGHEIQKGFQGEISHLNSIRIPVIENNQEMLFFQKELYLRKSELLYSCFAIRNHGTYAWGRNILEAKRHLETLDYLCKYEWNSINK